MKKKLGSICMVTGLIMVLMALGLFVYNTWEAQNGGKLSNRVLMQMKDVIKKSEDDDPYNIAMKEIEIDGYDYIGFLSMPSLDIELPVMSEWDYDRLKIAPCRYYGSINSRNLVICAHSYRQHFGQLSNLNQGDHIYFTDVEKNTYTYKVEVVDVYMPEAIEEVTSGEFDLVLFTCTYDGGSRITAKCKRL